MAILPPTIAAAARDNARSAARAARRVASPAVVAAIILLLLAAVVVRAAAPRRSSNSSKWVRTGADARLVYTPDARGNVIPDYSYAGYKSGGVALPVAAVKVTLS